MQSETPEINNKITNRLLVKACIEEFSSHDIEQLSRLFYRELFHLDINLKSIFTGSINTLNGKFSSTLGVLKNVEFLEKITRSVEQIGARHMLRYGAQIEHFDIVKNALLYALSEQLNDRLSVDLKDAWIDVYDDVASVMKGAMLKVDQRNIKRLYKDDRNNYPGFLEAIGGEQMITRVHQRFYDVIFDHPWLGQFFSGKPKVTLIIKQTQFMLAAFNGPNKYLGDTPAFIHMHMYITEEMSDLRSQLLKDAILAEGLSESMAEHWLAVDNAFRASIVKKSVDECVLKCRGQIPIVAKKPE
ncbi:MAG: globin domain-containing protein [Methylococcales bacterium]